MGGAGSDRIIGTIDTVGTADTFDAGDVIDGGAGTDTLAITVVGTLAGPTTGGIVSNVETISVSNANSVSTALDFSNTTGANTFNLTSGQDGVILTVSNLPKIVDVSLAGNGGLTMAYQTAATAGTTDAQKVTLNGIAPALSTSTSNTFTANGIETLNITGAKASVVNVAGTSIRTINVDGASNVRVVTAEPTVTTMDASKATGAVILAATAATGVNKMSGGSGDDTLSFGGTLTRSVSIDGGAGKDKLSLGNTTFATDAFANVKNIETIALNAASAATSIDVKSVTGLTDVISSVTQTAVAVIGTVADGLAVPPVPNAGQLGISNLVLGGPGVATGAQILAFQELSSVNATAYTTAANLANASTVGVDNLASGSTFTLESRGLKALFETDPTAFDLLGQGAVTLSVFQASNAANTSDALNLVIDNNSAYAVKNTALGAVNAAKNLYVISSVTLPNVEKVSLNSTGSFGGNTIASLAVTAANSVVITGTQNLTIGTASTAGLDVSNVDSVSLDASGLTGRLSLTVSSAELGNFSGGLKGGTAADTLIVTAADGANVLANTTGIESVVVAVAADASAIVDFSGFSGATTKRVTLAANVAPLDVDTVTVKGLSNGDTLQLQGTHTAESLAIEGAGSGSSLKLDFSQDATAAFASAGIALTRVANLEINTTRVDGTDSNLTVVQQPTTINGVNSSTLKTLKVTGVQDAFNVLTLGSVVNAGAGISLLESVDLSGFAGSIAPAGLVFDTTAGSKGVTVTLNKATAVGTAATLVADEVAGLTGAAVASGIALGAGSDTIKFDSTLGASVVISNFAGGVGATVSSGIDVLDLRAMGINFADITFTDFSSVATPLLDDANNAVQLSFTSSTSVIQIMGITSAALNSANFLLS